MITGPTWKSESALFIPKGFEIIFGIVSAKTLPTTSTCESESIVNYL